MPPVRSAVEGAFGPKPTFIRSGFLQCRPLSRMLID
jgi:hypothetical protein